jgi:transcriptional regulator with XRE-family HTH domain
VDPMSTPLDVPVDLPDGLATLPDAIRRRELAAFLRSRRERLTPHQVGIPITGRRRTPGLRREEVAQLAGVGVTWYTWLEQGRDIRPSDQVLGAIARTLQLDAHEAAHLFTLAGLPARASQQDCNAVPPGAAALLDRLDPWPAMVQNPRTDILAYNRGYNWLLGDVDELPFEERNTMLQ